MSRHKKTLLERAAEIRVNREHGNTHKYSDQELELVQAWLDGTIRASEVSEVLGIKQGNQIYSFFALGARVLYRKSKQ